MIEKIPLGLIFSPVVWISLQSHAGHIQSFISPDLCLFTLVSYIKKFFYPVRLVAFYGFSQPLSFENPEYIGALIQSALLIFLLVYFRKNRIFIFSFFFYLFTIFPFLRFTMFDRFIYLPSVGICLWLGSVADSLYEKSRLKKNLSRGLIIIGLAVTGMLSYKTFQQCLVWRDGVSFWSYQLRNNKGFLPGFVFNKLFEAYLEQKDFREKLVLYRAQLAPEDAGLSSPLLTPADIEEIRRVIRLGQKGVHLRPGDDNVYYNLGVLYGELGKKKMAFDYFAKAAELNPENFDAYFHLGRLYQDSGQDTEALEAYRRAVSINPDHEEMYLRVIEACREAVSSGGGELYREGLAELLTQHKERFE